MARSFPGLYKFVIDGVDVTSYVYKLSDLKLPAGQAVKTGILQLKKSVNEVLVINDTVIGDSITIQRGFTVSTERYILRGEVVSYKNIGSIYEFTVADKFYAGSRREKDYTYDINIDVETGVGSEIVKSLFEVIEVPYDSNTVQSTGTTDNLKINIYPAKGYVINSLKDLASIYLFQTFYNSDEDLAYFIPEGFTSTSTILSTDSDIPARIPWLTTGEDMINNLTIIGGTQLDWNSQTFSGDGSLTEFTLAAKPVDTEITVDSVLLNRGVNSSDPNDFYVKSNSKTIVFTVAPSNSASNVVVRYSYNVPVKVNSINQESIDSYNQHDSTLINDKLTNSDDAEIRVNTLIEDRAEVLTSAPIKVIGNNNLEVGQQIQIIDKINSLSRNVVVKSIVYSYPYVGDFVDVGKPPADSMDIQLSQLQNIYRLQRQLATDSDINVQLFKENNSLVVLGYQKLEVATADSDVLYWDSDVQGTWDDFDWGDDTEETYSVSSLIPVNNVVFEDFYSTEYRSASTTATWGTTGSVSFTIGQVAESEYYFKDLETNVINCTLSASFTGSLLFEVSADGINWETVSNNIAHSFVSTGNYLFWRATENNGSTAELTKLKVIING